MELKVLMSRIKLKKIVKLITYQFFDTFNQVGSASGTVKYFRRNGLKFPRKLLKGPNKGDVLWGDLVFSRALAMLHNPRYAGAFFYGRTRISKLYDGKTKHKKFPRDQCHGLARYQDRTFWTVRRHRDCLLWPQPDWSGVGLVERVTKLLIRKRS